MKRIYNKDSRLESQRWFPYAAWALVIGFSLFVYNLVLNVEARITALEARANSQLDTYNVAQPSATSAQPTP
jgi:hypothetical protein